MRNSLNRFPKALVSGSLNLIAFLFLTFALAACATSAEKNVADGGKLGTKSSEKENTADSVMSQPFKDLGIIKKSVPPALAQIANPYAVPKDIDCTYVKYQLTQLDDALGPESVRPSNFDDRNSSEKNTEIASQAATSALKSAASSWIPARSIVRKLTGAEKADNEWQRAVELGKVRRGFLWGIFYAKNCDAN